jgi:peptidoglycan/LPS O-acetylase OafA/YrhL
MNKTFSLYLDLVRFLAAVLVVLSHYLRFGIFDESVAAYIPDLGREAVIVFFVLSGYVIAYTTDNKQFSLREYAIARFSRIYSVAAPVLLIAFATVFIATHIKGGEVGGTYVIDHAYFYIPFHLLFLGELWNFSEVPPWLGAYWSLGYEVWYYVLFGTIYYLSGARRSFFILLVLAAMGHKLWLLMPVWWAGVFLYRNQNHFQPGRKAARAGWLITLLLFFIYKGIGLDHALRELGNHIWGLQVLKLGSSDRYLADYVVCLLVSLHFFFALHAKFESIARFQRAIKAFSAYTFTLYLVHGLAISAWKYFLGKRYPTFSDALILTALIIAVTFLIGMITEQRKAAFRKFFGWMLKSSGDAAFQQRGDERARSVADPAR